MKKLVSAILLVGLLAGTVSAGASFAMDPDPKKPGQNMAMQESEASGHRQEKLNEEHKEAPTLTGDVLEIAKEFAKAKGGLGRGFTYEDYKELMPSLYLKEIKVLIKDLSPKDALKILMDRVQNLMKYFIIAKQGVSFQSDEILMTSMIITFIEDYKKRDVVSQTDVDNLAKLVSSAEVVIIQDLVQLELDKRR